MATVYNTKERTQGLDTLSMLRELRMYRQWVSFRIVPDPAGGKAQKRAFTPGMSQLASSTDPATWGTFEAAWADVEAGRADLPGFAFTTDDPYFLVDWDGCVDPVTGAFTDPEAQAEFASFPGYREWSQSGGGAHAIGRGVKPGERCRTGNIEIYDTDRMLAITFNVIDGHDSLSNAQTWLTSTYNQRFSVTSAAGDTQATAAAQAAPIIHLEDRDLEAKLAKQGGKAARLLEGNAGDYNSPSEARAALGAYLCFYNAGVDQVERFIRHSSLFKDGETDSEKDRKARIDAEHVVEWYAQQGGARYSGPPPAADYENVDTETGEILDHDTATAGADTSEEVERWKRRARQYKRDRDQLLELITNPTLKPNEKLIIARTAKLAMQRPPNENGMVTLKPAEIANDWRRKPEAGENTPLTNDDGSTPYVARGSVTGLMNKITGEAELGCKKTVRLVEASSEVRKVSPRNGGKPWSETVWHIPRPESIGDYIEAAATFTTERRRNLRTITPPCPECGEVHPRTVQTETHYICHGCKGHWSEVGPARVEQPIVQIGPDETGPAPMENSLSPIEPHVIITGGDPSPKGDEAAYQPRRCGDCHAILSNTEAQLCGDCYEQHRQRQEAHHQRDSQRRRSFQPRCTDTGCDRPALAGQFYCSQHMGSEAAS